MSDTAITELVLGVWVLLIIGWSLLSTRQVRKSNREWRKTHRNRRPQK